jgi:hypothetical protein
MQRRDFILTAAGTAGALLAAGELAPAMAQVVLPMGDTLHIDPVKGDDNAAGDAGAPLRTLYAAMQRVNASTGIGAVTLVLTEGIHVIDRTVKIAPKPGRFSKDARLTIRAAVLPDDAGWHVGRMPTIIHTMPLDGTWNGRADPLGGAADGLLVETSHVTVRGLRILGRPVVETPVEGQILRLYSISRLDKSLDDLEIAQCLFVGDDFVAPSHVAIIALGNGLVVDHCVFRNLKIAAVFWQGGSTGHAMRHCVCDSLYGSSVWTSGIADDFVFANNVVSNGNYVWTNQNAASAAADEGGAAGAAPAAPVASLTYNVTNCHFAGNRRLSGSGTGARLEYKDIDSGFMVMDNTTITETPIKIPVDATRRDYLHVPEGSEAATLGAGLFL